MRPLHKTIFFVYPVSRRCQCLSHQACSKDSGCTGERWYGMPPVEGQKFVMLWCKSHKKPGSIHYSTWKVHQGTSCPVCGATTRCGCQAPPCACPNHSTKSPCPKKAKGWEPNRGDTFYYRKVCSRCEKSQSCKTSFKVSFEQCLILILPIVTHFVILHNLVSIALCPPIGTSPWFTWPTVRCYCCHGLATGRHR